MTIITKELLIALRKDIDAALVEIGKKHSLVINAGNASFQEQTATVKLSIAAIAEGETTTKTAKDIQAELDWNKWCGMLGLKKESLGKKFMHQGESYTILGCMPRRQKTPILVQTDAGRRFLMPLSVAVRADM